MPKMANRPKANAKSSSTPLNMRQSRNTDALTIMKVNT